MDEELHVAIQRNVLDAKTQRNHVSAQCRHSSVPCLIDYW